MTTTAAFRRYSAARREARATLRQSLAVAWALRDTVAAAAAHATCEAACEAAYQEWMHDELNDAARAMESALVARREGRISLDELQIVAMRWADADYRAQALQWATATR